jgi:predicted SprT family Zn-dependent metalloprotease
MAGELMGQHGLSAAGWRFEWFRGRSVAGMCNYGRLAIRLSWFLIMNPKVTVEGDVRNTLLHEIAHALTPGHKHDAEWRAMAQSIGCDGRRCHALGDLTHARWRLTCPCGACNFSRHRITARARGLVCKKCAQPLKVENNHRG